MNNELKLLLGDYADYSALFAKQVYSQELWSEQTGCEVDEYFDYVTCCEGKLYTFGTWFEHTQSLDYPAGPEWDQYRDFRQSLLTFHP